MLTPAVAPANTQAWRTPSEPVRTARPDATAAYLSAAAHAPVGIDRARWTRRPTAGPDAFSHAFDSPYHQGSVPGEGHASVFRPKGHHFRTLDRFGENGPFTPERDWQRPASVPFPPES